MGRVESGQSHAVLLDDYGHFQSKLGCVLDLCVSLFFLVIVVNGLSGIFDLVLLISISRNVEKC